MLDLITTSLPAFVFLLGVLVFVHEFGHFIVGRLCGIAAEIFSIGFGPKIFGFRLWGTDFRVSWIPLGGFVKFVGSIPGEEIPEHLQGKEFNAAPVWKRVLTVAAGPAANLLLAVVVYSALSLQGIPRAPAVIGEVVPGSPAYKAGLQFDDKVLEIDDEEVLVWSDLRKLISARPGKKTSIVVEREGQKLTMELTPAAHGGKDFLGRDREEGRAGIALNRVPSIVAVTDSSSAGAKLGLRTGDTVTAVAFDGEAPSPVKYLPQLDRMLDRARKQGKTSAELTLADDRKVTFSLDLGSASVDDGYLASLGIYNAQLAIGAIEESAVATLRRGDYLVRFNELELNNYYDLYEKVVDFPEPKARLTIVRDFQPLEIDLALDPVDVQKPEGRVTIYRLPFDFLGQPIQPDPVIEKADHIFGAIAFGTVETVRQSGWLLNIIKHLFLGDIPLKVLGGPISIAKQASDSVKLGFTVFFANMALISINLGLINLFPIPVLDGGQLVLLSAEAIRRRPLKESAVENFQKIGFALVLALVVISTYNDLSRYWKSMLEAIVGQFQ